MLDTSLLDKILRDTIKSIEKSKTQIFEIAEGARSELERVEQELLRIKKETLQVIEEVDRWEKEERKARIRLMEVSKNFDKFGEEDIRQAYENAKDIQIKVALLREKENRYKERRFELEVSYRNLKKTAERAEQLVTQVGVAMDYLSSNLQNIWDEVGKMQQRYKLGFAIIKAQEEERRRIARGIHDGPAQSLANIVLMAEYCQRLLHVRPEDLEKELDQLKKFTRKNLEDIRKILFDLRPMDLDDLGLVAALKRIVAEFQDKTGIKVKFTQLGQEMRYAPALEVAIFRIIQEALNNVRKHAQAAQVDVTLEMRPLMISAMVIDDGVGFRLTENTGAESFGLRGMKEWAELLEGSVTIQTAPGEGTKVAIKIPVNEE